MEEILGTYGWDDHWSVLFAHFADGDVQPGRIVRHDRAAPLVATSRGLVHLPVRRNVGTLTVGDWVVVEDGEVIVDILERSSVLRRRDPGADEQLLAANVDVVAMVFGSDRPLKAGRLFRMRTQIWDAGAVPLVVLTKTDLVEDDRGIEVLVGRVHEIDPLLDVVAVSCVTGAGLDALRRHVGGRTLALVGESGAGKSTLVNALVGGDVASVSAVRATDHRGRHTTTSRELHPLPGGGVLVDTPGLREVGLWTDESAVDSVFPEIEEHARACRYRDCTHGSEPGCAVRAAVAGGHVSAERFAAWESLRKEAAAAALRADNMASVPPSAALGGPSRTTSVSRATADPLDRPGVGRSVAVPPGPRREPSHPAITHRSTSLRRVLTASLPLPSHHERCRAPHGPVDR